MTTHEDALRALNEIGEYYVTGSGCGVDKMEEMGKNFTTIRAAISAPVQTMPQKGAPLAAVIKRERESLDKLGYTPQMRDHQLKDFTSLMSRAEEIFNLAGFMLVAKQ